MLSRFFTDNTNIFSVSYKLRKKRFLLLNEMIEKCNSLTVQILDVGGTERYWKAMFRDFSIKKNYQITLINFVNPLISLQNFTGIEGDAREMHNFDDKQFDIVYSNSTIEHVGNYIDQKKMADEIIRIGKQYFVQTPNRFFPIEPHFIFPFFQFLPISLRVWLTQNFKLGWIPKTKDRLQAWSRVTEIRLITKEEMKDLFPNAEIIVEKFLGLPKSFIALTREK